MNCPNCSEAMEYENGLDFSTGGETGTPNATYVCLDCGYTAVWTRGEPGLHVLFDPKVDATVES